MVERNKSFQAAESGWPLSTWSPLAGLTLSHFQKEQLQTTMPRWLGGGRYGKQGSESTEEDPEITAVLGSGKGRAELWLDPKLWRRGQAYDTPTRSYLGCGARDRFKKKKKSILQKWNLQRNLTNGPWNKSVLNEEGSNLLLSTWDERTRGREIKVKKTKGKYKRREEEGGEEGMGAPLKLRPKGDEETLYPRLARV